jgi:hypothetical protein
MTEITRPLTMNIDKQLHWHAEMYALIFAAILTERIQMNEHNKYELPIESPIDRLSAYPHMLLAVSHLEGGNSPFGFFFPQVESKYVELMRLKKNASHSMDAELVNTQENDLFSLAIPAYTPFHVIHYAMKYEIPIGGLTGNRQDTGLISFDKRSYREKIDANKLLVCPGKKGYSRLTPFSFPNRGFDRYFEYALPSVYSRHIRSSYAKYPFLADRYPIPLKSHPFPSFKKWVSADTYPKKSNAWFLYHSKY